VIQPSDFSVLKNFRRKTHSWKSHTELAVKRLPGFHHKSNVSYKYSPELNPVVYYVLKSIRSQSHHHHHHRIVIVGRRVARPWWPRSRACLQRSAGVWLVSFRIWSIHLPRGRPGRRLQENGEDDWVRGWRETVGLHVLGCCPAVWRCDQRRRCDDVGWRRWRQVDQWAQIFPSCERTASMRFSGFCVGISCGMPPGTWHLLKWESMSRRHRVGRTGREQDKRVFW